MYSDYRIEASEDHESWRIWTQHPIGAKRSGQKCLSNSENPQQRNLQIHKTSGWHSSEVEELYLVTWLLPLEQAAEIQIGFRNNIVFSQKTYFTSNLHYIERKWCLGNRMIFSRKSDDIHVGRLPLWVFWWVSSGGRGGYLPECSFGRNGWVLYLRGWH